MHPVNTIGKIRSRDDSIDIIQWQSRGNALVGARGRKWCSWAPSARTCDRVPRARSVRLRRRASDIARSTPATFRPVELGGGAAGAQNTTLTTPAAFRHCTLNRGTHVCRHVGDRPPLPDSLQILCAPGEQRETRHHPPPPSRRNSQPPLSHHTTSHTHFVHASREHDRKN